ncbi:unnamed protein product [Bursaphelenchus xylophilus]|uniref:(pine wood nematode) hypothetical protein n=1 Tax=Bursaphelenchus xylophilus TaxID=6326 RepID=A0A1I7S6A6_BURXY|nr:unnamed protein product [Bursaphelenchus xylophilus]CAG9128192.1 unnamed protein product [Bursaphelenchus xylophilus]
MRSTILFLPLILVFGVFPTTTSALQVRLDYNVADDGRALEFYRPSRPLFDMVDGNSFEQWGDLRRKRNRTRPADSLFMQLEAVQDESYNLICVMLLLMTALFMLMQDCNGE